MFLELLLLGNLNFVAQGLIIIFRKLVKICKPRLIFIKLGFIITMSTVTLVLIIIVIIKKR
jgi:hypothetical protein